MLNNKFIKIIIAIIVVFILIFSYLFMKEKNVTTNTKNISTAENDSRLPLNTDTNNTGTTTVGGNGYYTNTPNLNPTDYSSNNPEDILKNKIEKLLFNWSLTKDESTLREALVLSEGIDNEVVLEAWIPFMKENSNELIKLINTSSNKQKTKTTINIIFQWYIQLSGEYEKLSNSQKLQIKNQYNQLK